MVEYAFHPDALLEYAEAVNYYLLHASPDIAERFVALVESAVKAIVAAPERWPLVEERGDSPLPAPTIPVFALLRLGSREGTRDYPGGNALQPQTGLLERAKRHIAAAINWAGQRRSPIEI
jgi:plasmid stabilization system protein ParE